MPKMSFDEIIQTIRELNDSLSAQCLLRDTLINNTKIMVQVSQQLKDVQAYLKNSNETIKLFNHENQSLKASVDLWMRRAIQLEFKFLNAADSTKKRP